MLSRYPFLLGRRWLRNIACFIALFLTGPALWAQEASPSGYPPLTLGQEPAANPFLRDHVDSAIDRGIVYLITKQRDDGAITSGGAETALTSLAIMAMAGVGHLPADETPAGAAMRKALDFVLQEGRQDDQGYFGRRDSSRMYGHGIVTLMLTEMLGMGASAAQDQLIHDRLQRAIDLILASQAHPKPEVHRGGWRYEPTSPDADLSVTVWQVMALRSAKNDGLDVPATAIDQAIAYLQRSFTSSIRPDGQPADAVAGFSYQAGHRNPTFTMTSAGLLAMQVCGQYDSPFVHGAVAWLKDRPPRWQERFSMYGTYYYAQAMAGQDEQTAQQARRLVQEMLLEHQQEDGSWVARDGEERSRGGVYGTSLAILSLCVKYHYLPIYQR